MKILEAENGNLSWFVQGQRIITVVMTQRHSLYMLQHLKQELPLSIHVPHRMNSLNVQSILLLNHQFDF